MDSDYSLGRAADLLERRQDGHDQAEAVEVVRRRVGHLASDRLLDEPLQGRPEQELLRLRAGLLPGQRDRACRRRTPQTVVLQAEQGLQPGVVHLQRAVADLSAPAGLGPDLAVAARAQVRQRPPARFDQGRRRERLQVPRHAVQVARHVGAPRRCGASSTDRSSSRASPATGRSRWSRTRTTRARPSRRSRAWSSCRSPATRRSSTRSVRPARPGSRSATCPRSTPRRSTRSRARASTTTGPRATRSTTSRST